MSRQVKITNGPDRLALAFALFNGDQKHQVAVLFHLEEDGQFWDESIKLDSVEREDGSGQNFNITGYNIANRSKVKIFFSLRDRSGMMTFLQ